MIIFIIADGDITDSICVCPGGEYDAGYGNHHGSRRGNDRSDDRRPGNQQEEEGNGEPSLRSRPVHITSSVPNSCVPTNQCFWQQDLGEDSPSKEEREEHPVIPGGGVDVDIDISGINPINNVNLQLLRLLGLREQSEFYINILEGEIMDIERNQADCIRRFYNAINHVDRNMEYSMYYDLQGRLNEVSSTLERERENLEEIREQIELMEEDVILNQGFGQGFPRTIQQFPGQPHIPRGDVGGRVSGGRAARYNPMAQNGRISPQ